MSDRHRHRRVVFRPPPEEVAAAKAELDARGRQMSAYLRACIRLVGQDADAAMAMLDPVWPEPVPAGRPAADAPGGEKELGDEEGRRRRRAE